MIDPSTFEPPPMAFPLTLEQPGETAARAPAIAPLSMSEALLSVPTAIDGLAAAFIGVAFYLGADFALAPLGIAGRRPFGESVEAAIGEAICADEQWLRDRQEGLASAAPLRVRLITASCFGVAGLAVERVLYATLEDAGFVLSLGICSCLGGSFYELIRPPLANRTEAELADARREEFEIFAASQISPGNSCHETEIVRAFRRSFAKYRRQEAISDAEICSLARQWARRTAGVERSAAGYYKGLVVAEVLDAFR